MGQTAAPSYMQPLAREIRGRKYWDLFCATVIGLSLSLFALNSSADEETTPAQVEVDSFKGPVLLDQVTPEYPINQLRAGEEAWVELYFMVDTDGKPYEVTAIDSIGHSSFRNAAIRAVKKWTYQPALYNGSNIDSGARFKVVFSIENQSRGASDWFVRLQKGLRQAISENEKEKADEYLNTLETTRRLNLYEDASFNFAKYEYMAKWGTEDQQLQALDRAIAHESLGTYLPTDVFVYALGKQLPLLLKKRDYQRAMVTNMNLAKQDVSDETRSRLDSIRLALEELRKSQESYDLTASLDENATWNICLFKDEFWFEDVQGRIVELKLRCQRDKQLFRYQPGVKYKIEERFGACYLEALGDRGTTFRLFQS